jgi:hypothetical protein
MASCVQPPETEFREATALQCYNHTCSRRKSTSRSAVFQSGGSGTGSGTGSGSHANTSGNPTAVGMANFKGSSACKIPMTRFRKRAVGSNTGRKSGSTTGESTPQKGSSQSQYNHYAKSLRSTGTISKAICKSAVFRLTSLPRTTKIISSLRSTKPVSAVFLACLVSFLVLHGTLLLDVILHGTNELSNLRLSNSLLSNLLNDVLHQSINRGKLDAPHTSFLVSADDPNCWNTEGMSYDFCCRHGSNPQCWDHMWT